MSRLAVLLGVFLTALAGAQNLAEHRTWTGKNGKRLAASLIKVDPQDGHYHLLDSKRNRSYKIDPANLSAADRKWVQDQLARADRSRPEPDAGGDPASFKPDPPKLSRSTLPIVDQSDYGSKASDCVPSSVCNFLMWWDQEDYLAIPKGRNPEKRAEWVHDRMAIYMRTRNNTGTYPARAREGITKYFEEHLEDEATLRTFETHDCSPANLARFTTGATATMLNLSVYYDDKRSSGHWVALSKADPSGEIEIITWGRRFECTLKKLEDPRRNPARREQEFPSYELVIKNTLNITDYMEKNDIRFVIDATQRDSLFVVKPYRFATPGKRVPLPRDNFFTEGVSNPLPVEPLRAEVPPPTIEFIQKATPTEPPGSDSAWKTLALAINGPPLELPHGSVHFEWKSPTTEGRFRIDFTESRYRVTTEQFAYIQDLNTGAFVIKPVNLSEKEVGWTEWQGRLRENDILPLPAKKIRNYYPDLEKTRKQIAGAPLADNHPWPARRWKAARLVSVAPAPELWVTPASQTAVMSALSQVVTNRDLHTGDLSRNPLVQYPLAALWHSGLLPSRLEWSYPPTKGRSSPKKWSLTLTKLSFQAPPPTLLDLPAHVALMAPGQRKPVQHGQ